MKLKNEMESFCNRLKQEEERICELGDRSLN
jgi:hypothetical protein